MIKGIYVQIVYDMNLDLYVRAQFKKYDHFSKYFGKYVKNLLLPTMYWKAVDVSRCALSFYLEEQ